MNTHQDIREIAGQVNEKLTHIVMSLKDMPMSESETPQERQAAINKVAYREFAYLSELKSAVTEHGKTHSLESERKAIELIRICNGHHDYLQQVLKRHRAIESFIGFVNEHHKTSKVDVVIGELSLALQAFRAVAPIFMHQYQGQNPESFVYTMITKVSKSELAFLLESKDTKEQALCLLKPFFVELSKDKKEGVSSVENRNLPSTLDDINWGYCRNALYSFHSLWVNRA